MCTCVCVLWVLEGVALGGTGSWVFCVAQLSLVCCARWALSLGCFSAGCWLGCFLPEGLALWVGWEQKMWCRGLGACMLC